MKLLASTASRIAWPAPWSEALLRLNRTKPLTRPNLADLRPFRTNYRRVEIISISKSAKLREIMDVMDAHFVRLSPANPSLTK